MSIRSRRMSDLFLALLAGSSARVIAGFILSLLVAASIWQAADNEAYGTGYVAAVFAGFWVVIEIAIRIWKSRPTSDRTRPLP